MGAGQQVMKRETEKVQPRQEQTLKDIKNKTHQFMIQLSHKKSIYQRRQYRYNKKRRNLTKRHSARP
jgi:hypothetical protein